jgi:peptide chain release factor 2
MVAQQLSEIEQQLDRFESLEKEVRDLEEFALLEGGDESLQKELEMKLAALESRFAKEELRIFLSGKYDERNALLSLYAGAGGQDAQDWAAMLLRMYERYCVKKGFKTKILFQSFGEPSPEGRIGIKSVTVEIEGPYAYGFLKGENGVHRLVRISPFSAQKLRHTSFARVEVLPDLEKDIEKELLIRPEDLRIETFRASGPGGQYVNRRETAVRITHLPTGISVSCQSERLQQLNREKAMKLLYAKLYQQKCEEQQKEKNQLRGKTISAEWGNQVRNYVLHPYKLVRDLRTKVETSEVERVLDGELDEFIEAEIRLLHDSAIS